MTANQGKKDLLEIKNISVPTLFKVPITDLLKNNNLPVFIPIVTDFLMSFSGVVGIFRLCGNYTMVQDLGIIFNLPECAVPPCASVHDVASFIKQWLRDLPEPLIPPDLINNVFNPQDPLTAISLLRQLPEINRKCLASLFAVLSLVLAQKSKNQMGPANIATCFVGSLTQDSKGLTKHFAFTLFFDTCVPYLNEDGNDFIFPQE